MAASDIQSVRTRGRDPGSALALVLVLVFVFVLTAFALSLPVLAAPVRVVSLDYCADQFLIALADRRQIAAVSADVANERSYLAAEAAGLPRTGDSAEEIIARRPDLVLRVWGGGYRAGDMMARFHVPVITIPFSQTPEDLRRSLRTVGRALGHGDRAEALIADMDRRLDAVAARWRMLPPERRPLAVYITPGGVSAGRGTLIDAMMQAAGVRNLVAVEGRAGWQTIDLERLLLATPDAVVLGFQDLAYNTTDRWQLGRHAALREFIAARPVAEIPSRVLSCPTWQFVDGVETIFATLVAPRLMATDAAP